MPLYRAELKAKKPLQTGALIHDLSQVLYLPFDYDDGSYARDRSGYGNHGTTYGATLTAGKIGMARNFDGVDDYVEIPHDSSLNLDSLTISLWVKINAWVTWGHLVRKQKYPVGRPNYYFLVRDTKQLRFGYTYDNVETYVDSDAFMTLNEWLHVAVTYDKTNIKFYLNGALRNTFAETRTLTPNTGYLRIGTFGAVTGQTLDGAIDDPRLCKRPLSQDEIRMLMYRRL